MHIEVSPNQPLRTCCGCTLSYCPWLAQQEFVSLVAELGQAQEGAAGLLIEVKGETQQQLQQNIEAAQQALRASGVRFGGNAGAPLGLESYPFRVNPAVSTLASGSNHYDMRWRQQ
jgi:hypothetical protein